MALRWRRTALLGLAAALALVPLVRFWRTRGIGPVQRGRAVAEASGCFNCHPGGGAGFEDPGQDIGSVPAFSAEDLSAYARDTGEIREWILDGAPRRIREEAAMEDDRRLLRMPAWRGVLSEREVDDLAAYLTALSDFEAPPEGETAEGRRVAARLGCFGCHGPEGRGSPPNPRSFMGYIPAWDGPDFPELAQDEGEVREWILEDAGLPRPHRARGAEEHRGLHPLAKDAGEPALRSPRQGLSRGFRR